MIGWPAIPSTRRCPTSRTSRVRPLRAGATTATTTLAMTTITGRTPPAMTTSRARTLPAMTTARTPPVRPPPTSPPTYRPGPVDDRPTRTRHRIAQETPNARPDGHRNLQPRGTRLRHLLAAAARTHHLSG